MEKMEKEIIQVVENLPTTPNGTPERSLVVAYKHNDTIVDTEAVPFEKGRITVEYDGKLYDWYGREVELPPTSRIIDFYGGGRDRDGNINEQFIILFENGAFAIAGVQYFSDGEDIGIPTHKDLFTGRIIGRSPKLVYEHTFMQMDMGFVNTPVFQAFVQNLPEELRSHRFVALYGFDDDSKSIITRQGIDTPSSYVWHTFASVSREEVLEKLTPVVPPKEEESEQQEPTIKRVFKQWQHCSATYFTGGIVVSKDGQKMTVCFPDNPGRFFSTDVEVLKLCHNGRIIWYPA